MTPSINQLVLDLEQRVMAKPDLKQLTEYFTATPAKELAAYIYALNQAPSLALHFENILLSKTELQKSILIYLGIHNLAHNITTETDEATNELLATQLGFNGLKEVEQTRQDKILIGYLFSGLVLIKNFHQETFALPEKIVIKHCHDNGGFSPSIWGVKFDLDLLKKSIEKLAKLERNQFNHVIKNHQSIDWASLLMLAHL